MTADEEAKLDKETQAELARLRAELADVTAGRQKNIELRDIAEAELAKARAQIQELKAARKAEGEKIAALEKKTRPAPKNEDESDGA